MKDKKVREDVRKIEKEVEYWIKRVLDLCDVINVLSDYLGVDITSPERRVVKKKIV